MPGPTTRVAALLTCHNRRALTVRAVQALSSQQGGAAIDLFLHDDGSTDGTGDAVLEVWPGATVVQGDGSRFWCGGMRAAWTAALDGGYDHYLWINDDTVLDTGALEVLLDNAAAHPAAVVVGATRDPETGTATYGGVIRTRRSRPLRFSLVDPGPRAQQVTTMNGNCVLIPQVVVDSIGILDPAFTHGLGDFDYGLRARKAGFDVVLAAGTLACCSRNPVRERARPGVRAARAEWQHLTHVKVIPPAEWRRFASRHAGALWPLYWISPYLRRIAQRTLRG